MGDEIISNDVSREGMQTLHVARMGKATEVAGWMDLLQEGSWDSLHFMRWVDEMDVHHLVMTWNVRGMQSFQLSAFSSQPDKKEVWGVMWWIANGQRMSEAIQEAAERFFLDFGRDAGVAVCRMFPKNAPKECLRIPVLGTEIELELMEADWSPKNSVVMLQDKQEAMWLTKMR